MTTPCHSDENLIACTKCGVPKPDAAYFHRPATGKLRQPCMTCNTERGKAWKRGNLSYLEKSRGYRRAALFKLKFGITVAEYEALLAAQGGVCAICGNGSRVMVLGRFKNLGIDHDHLTGRIRGVLCDHCNRGIGLLGDDPERLRKAADYLEH